MNKDEFDLDIISYDEISQLSEIKIRKQIIIPLLKELGVEKVIDMHGKNEEGIDVYFESYDIFYHKRKFRIQVKKGDLVYTSRTKRNNILTIINQIKMSFSKEIKLYDSQSGKTSTFIDGYYIIISGRASENAREFIFKERKT